MLELKVLKFMIFLYLGFDHIDLMFLCMYGVFCFGFFLLSLYVFLLANGRVMWLLIKVSTFD